MQKIIDNIDEAVKSGLGSAKNKTELNKIIEVVRAWETLGAKENMLPDIAMRVIEIINNEICEHEKS